MDAVHVDKSRPKVSLPSRVVLCTTNIICLAALAARIVIGFHFDDDCPVDWLIPLYMKVPGGGFLFSIFLVWIATVKPLQDMTLAWTGTIVIGLFCFVWQLIGSIWVCPYFNEVQYELPGEDNYCNKHLFRYAQGSIILEWIVYVVGLVAAVIKVTCSREEEKRHSIWSRT